MDVREALLTNEKTPIPSDIVSEAIKEARLDSLGQATIREIVKLVNTIQERSGERFIRMEMGVPGLEPPQIGIQSEKDALDKGVASKYPMIDGIPSIKKEIQRFVKLFINRDVSQAGCVATVGSMQGGFASFLVSSHCQPGKNTTLFIDPGFPVQKMQHKVLRQPYETFDVYDYRGEKLRDKLEEMMRPGHISSLIYSNPNNPSWICFTPDELQIIADVARKYDVIVIEDLAYFGMDFREDYSQPGQPPYQPSIAHYYDKYLLLISSSKAFSYAGQRVAAMVISDSLYQAHFPELKARFGASQFGRAMIYGALYTLSAGVTHSAQHGMAGMLKAVNDGAYNFVEGVQPYQEKAREMKKIFTANGFQIVYDHDQDVPIADGFYFTISYPGMDGPELLERLLYYGISAIALQTTGSEHTEGLRACVSQVAPEQFGDLEKRVQAFSRDFS